MATFFLLLIYLTFISLGLPDSLLGAAWPLMRADLRLPLDAAGILSFIVASGTVISSLLSERMVKRFGTGKVTTVSVAATALALLGYSVAPSLPVMVLLCLPLGLGAGAIDAALNNYVALHYAAHHMSWLHSFWGVGASLGPVILSLAAGGGGTWRSAYLIVACIQCGLALLLVVTLPLWRRQGDGRQLAQQAGATETSASQKDGKQAGSLRIPGVIAALLTFTFYCGIESVAGLWSSSFLVESRSVLPAIAARGSALFFGGIMVGRFLNGFLTMRFSSKQLIRTGAAIILVSGVMLALPLPPLAAFGALGLLGLGCAPVYPSMIHETPYRFGKENSQRIIGFQMASAYVGSTLMPPLVGWVSARAGIQIVPWFILIFGALMLLCSEWVTKTTGGR